MAGLFDDIFEGVKDVFAQGQKAAQDFFDDITGVSAAEKDAKKLKKFLKRGPGDAAQFGPTAEERARIARLRGQRKIGRASTFLTSQLGGTLLGSTSGTEKTLLGR